MKKLCVLMLALVMLFALAACSKTGEDETTTQPTETTGTESFEDVTAKDFSTISDDETVTITFPKALFGDDEPSTELTDEQKAQGIETAYVGDDGSLNYTLSGKNYKTFMEQITQDTATELSGLGENFACVKKVEYSSDFSKVNVYVNMEEFQADPFQNAVIFMQVELDCEVYQACSGLAYDEMSLDVRLIDVDSGEELLASHYPESETQ